MWPNVVISSCRIGCGTGKFTKSLLANAEWAASIAELHCVEPVEGMLKALRETVNDPRVHSYQGTFDVSGIESSGFADLIVVATVSWLIESLPAPQPELIYGQ